MKKKAFPTSTRQALNRTLRFAGSYANKEIRKNRAIKASYVKNKLIQTTQARGNMVSMMWARLVVKGTPISMIHFVRGSKTPRKQKGVKVRSRRKVNVTIKPGMKETKRFAFIAKGRGGNVQLFQRKGKKRLPLFKQSVAAASRIFDREGARTKAGQEMEIKATRQFEKEFNRAFSYNIDKLRR